MCCGLAASCFSRFDTHLLESFRCSGQMGLEDTCKKTNRLILMRVSDSFHAIVQIILQKLTIVNNATVRAVHSSRYELQGALVSSDFFLRHVRQSLCLSIMTFAERRHRSLPFQYHLSSL